MVVFAGILAEFPNASGHTKLSTIEHPARPTPARDAAPAEGPRVTATRHRAGLTRHPVIELAGDGSPLLCRWRFTDETARAASAGALGHGLLPGSYEELAAAR
jgi:hypothetical protein